MRIENQTSISIGNNSKSERYNEKNNEKNNEKKKKVEDTTVFAGDLNMPKDPIVKKREEAQKKAMKVVGDAFTNEKKIDDDLQERRDRISKLGETMGNAQNEINKFEERKLELKESYGIEDDSEEQMDLELLEKERDDKKNFTFTLSEEEMAHLKEIHKAGETEYQTRCLELDKYADASREEIKKAKKGIIEENAVIRGIKLERLKKSPMLEATEEAEDIMDAASAEIMGMLVEETKDYIDDKKEEEQEKAEEKAEEEEQQEEQLEAIKEKREEIEKLADPEKKESSDNDGSKTEINNEMPTENILKMDQAKNDIKIEIENIVDKMKLVAEDIKGAVVDSKL